MGGMVCGTNAAVATELIDAVRHPAEAGGSVTRD